MSTLDRPSDRSPVSDAAYWLKLAEDMRSDAAKATTPEDRRMLLGFADGYASLAKRIAAPG